MKGKIYNSNIKWKWSKSISIKLFIPLFIFFLLLMLALAFALSRQLESKTRDHLIKETLFPHFKVLANEKNQVFDNVKDLTQHTAKNLTSRINNLENYPSSEIEKLFSKYYALQTDGTYRSKLDSTRGRFQMAGFHSNNITPGSLEKSILADAFYYFESFSEGLMTTVHDCYFSTNNLIWEYGAPDWPLTIESDVIFNKYNWYYEADPAHNPEGKQVWTDMYYDKFQKTWMISSLMPIYNKEKFIGTLGQDLILSNIISFASSKKEVSDQENLFFVDKWGNIIAHPETIKLLKKDAANDEKLNIKAISDTILTKAIQSFNKDSDIIILNGEKSTILFYETLPAINWKLVRVLPEKQITSMLKEAVNQFIITFFILAMILFISILTIIYFVVTRPTHHFIRHLRKLPFKDLGTSNFNPEITFYGQGEIRYLESYISELISFLHQSSEDMAENEQLQRDLLNNTPAAIYIKDIEGRYLFVNNLYEKLFNLTNDSIQGKKDTDIFPQEIAKKLINNDQKVLSEGKILEFEETIFNDGIEHIYTTIKFPSRDIHNKTYAVCGISTDITEKKLSEKEKDKLKEQLHQSQKMEAVGQLAGGVAHDFNNILGAILGFADLLKSEILSGKHEKYVDMILSGGERAAELTKKLLTFSRRGNKANENLDSYEIIKETVSLLKHTIDKSISIHIENSASDTTILGDRSMLQNVLMNIAINASQAMPNGGKLKFYLQNTTLDETHISISHFDITPGYYVQLSIRDTGTGMPPEIVSRIFEPFFTTKTNGKGTGLGLAAVYGAIQDHNGAITVYSEVDVGTEFHIYLPVSSHEVINKVEEERIPKGTGSILLIDDENLVRTAAGDLLKSLGYSVTFAENGLEGLNTFKKSPDNFDLIILDMIMPVMGGREAFKKIREIRSDIPIIISSGFSKEGELEELKEHNVNGFLSKPFRKAKLANKLAEVLNANPQNK